MNDLNPELVDYLEEGLIHHPLLIMSVGTGLIAEANARFTQKRALAVSALETGRWNEYVFLHERPYRLDALNDCISTGLNGSAYWALVGEVWCDSANIFQNKTRWEEIWSSNEPQRHSCMTTDEQAFLSSLKWPQTVWRGGTDPIDLSSLSWTLDRKVAADFAKRHARESKQLCIASRIVRDAEVLACFLRRKEHEIVCRSVTIESVERL